MSLGVNKMGRQAAAAMLAAALALAGCTGKDGATGPQGPKGDPGANASAFATLSGVVKNTNGIAVAGATVSTVVGADTLSATAAADGSYSLLIPSGLRDVTYASKGYVSMTLPFDIVPGGAVSQNVNLNPSAAVVAGAAASATSAAPGTAVTLTGSVQVFDGSSPTVAYHWTQLAGPPATISDAAAAAPTVTLADLYAFKKYAVELSAPYYKVNPDEPAENVDRFQIVPFSYERALTLSPASTFQVEATVAGQKYTAKVTVNATGLPIVQTTGLAAIPVKNPVVLQGQFPFKDSNGADVFPPRTTWAWTLTGPAGSTATLRDADKAYPDFTPDVVGTYTVTEGGNTVLTIYAGEYAGVMSAAATASTSCTGCHNGTVAPDQFTPWLSSGHKEVIWSGIAEPLPDGHYSSSCTPCHTAGSGLKNAKGFADFMTGIDFSAYQGDVNAEVNFWKVTSNESAAQRAGIQCENCHGPQGGTGNAAHMKNAARVTLASDVCATCHARAPRHGRFTMWQTSAHASFATFTFNADPTTGALSTGCAVCHSAEGFKAWREKMPTANGNRNTAVLPAGLTKFTANPITCASCHKPHQEGEVVVEAANLVDVGPAEGQTYVLPAGFAAVGVGKGALCISCHNSRQGYSTAAGLVGPYLHEDGDPRFGTLTSYGAPHEAAQGDVLMGRNAYWLGAATLGSPSTRSKHSYIADTCVTCHMELTTLDPAKAMEGQTRHDMIATPDVCNKCHTAYSAESLQAAFEPELVALKATVGQSILLLKYGSAGAIPAATTAALVANRSGQVDVTTSGVTKRWFIGDKTGQDAFLYDPLGALVEGCAAPVGGASNCTGFLTGGVGIVFTDPTQDGTVSATGFNPVIAKALWNTVLVQDDASRGIHNPSFAFQVMDESQRHVASFLK